MVCGLEQPASAQNSFATCGHLPAMSLMEKSQVSPPLVAHVLQTPVRSTPLRCARSASGPRGPRGQIAGGALCQ